MDREATIYFRELHALVHALGLTPNWTPELSWDDDGRQWELYIVQLYDNWPRYLRAACPVHLHRDEHGHLFIAATTSKPSTSGNPDGGTDYAHIDGPLDAHPPSQACATYLVHALAAMVDAAADRISDERHAAAGAEEGG